MAETKIKECPVCGKEFVTGDGRRKFCSAECGKVRKRERNHGYNRRYYEANREKIRERSREYYESNREKVRERQYEYYQANRERILESRREHYQANREKTQEYWREYRKANRKRLREQQREYRKRRKAESAKTVTSKPRKCEFTGSCFECPYPDCIKN